MKKLFIAASIVLTGSFTFAAAVTTENATTTTNTVPATNENPAPEVVRFTGHSFRNIESQSNTSLSAVTTRGVGQTKDVGIVLGYSSLTDGDDSIGHGITAGAEWYYNQFIGVGANYSHFDASNGSNFWTMAGYFRGTPIHYQYEDVNLAASINIGTMWTGSKYEDNVLGTYFGAGLEAKFIEDIGVRLEQTISTETNSQTSIGFVGYY